MRMLLRQGEPVTWRGEGVPEVRVRVAEGSRSHGGQMDSGDGQADGGSRPERPGRGIDMEEGRKESQLQSEQRRDPRSTSSRLQMNRECAKPPLIWQFRPT
ncbi:unnamed protein product [Pleuronectes platessa]|uniref:Uncharacterized protein n=1 Tax=Pleuronectes platessa TaxID=8262 RepID=A0A9N7V3H4_PLEPL|nr:unnamed protein product [Pleuronectes platessa]